VTFRAYVDYKVALVAMAFNIDHSGKYCWKVSPSGEYNNIENTPRFSKHNNYNTQSKYITENKSLRIAEVIYLQEK